jgi:hypothetical protein
LECQCLYLKTESILRLLQISVSRYVLSVPLYVFTVLRLLTDFVCLYTHEFWFSLCKIVFDICFTGFGTALTTILPILYSRNLWAVMKAGGLAL